MGILLMSPAVNTQFLYPYTIKVLDIIVNTVQLLTWE